MFLVVSLTVECLAHSLVFDVVAVTGFGPSFPLPLAHTHTHTHTHCVRRKASGIYDGCGRYCTQRYGSVGWTDETIESPLASWICSLFPRDLMPHSETHTNTHTKSRQVKGNNATKGRKATNPQQRFLW